MRSDPAEELEVPDAVWTIVVAGGSGRRYAAGSAEMRGDAVSDAPAKQYEVPAKQYEMLDGVRVLDRSLATAAACSDGVVVALPAEDVDAETSHLVGIGAPTPVTVVAGGDTRSGSVRAALAAVPEGADFVLVHDAARPAASADLYRRVLDALRGTPAPAAVVPGVPVTDSIRHLHHGAVDRKAFVAVQTPQGFRAAALRDAHAAGGDATDDATLVEASGGFVAIVDGEADNVKLTQPADRFRLEAVLGAVADPAAQPAAPGEAR